MVATMGSPVCERAVIAPAAFLEGLKARGLFLSRNGDTLLLHGPEEARTEKIRAFIRQHKPALVEYLKVEQECTRLFVRVRLPDIHQAATAEPWAAAEAILAEDAAPLPLLYTSLPVYFRREFPLMASWSRSQVQRHHQTRLAVLSLMDGSNTESPCPGWYTLEDKRGQKGEVREQGLFSRSRSRGVDQSDLYDCLVHLCRAGLAADWNVNGAKSFRLLPVDRRRIPHTCPSPPPSRGSVSPLPFRARGVPVVGQ